MIQFKDIRAGHTLYLFDRKTKDYIEAKVESVKPPYFSVNGNTPAKVVDVTLQLGDTVKTYVLGENASVSYAGSLMLATEKQQVVLEVQSMRGTAEAAVKAYDENVRTVELCDKVLERLDSSIAEKKETERRFSAIERNLESMMGKLNDLVGKLS